MSVWVHMPGMRNKWTPVWGTGCGSVIDYLSSTHVHQQNQRTLVLEMADKHWLLWQGTQVQYSAPTRQLTTTWNSSSRGFRVLFWPLQDQAYTQRTHIHAGKHAGKHKSFKILFARKAPHRQKPLHHVLLSWLFAHLLESSRGAVVE